MHGVIGVLGKDITVKNLYIYCTNFFYNLQITSNKQNAVSDIFLNLPFNKRAHEIQFDVADSHVSCIRQPSPSDTVSRVAST